MIDRFRRAALFAVPLAGLAALPGIAQAQTAPLTMDGLSTMLGNMGYETKVDPNGKLLTITARGNYDLTINFAQNAPGGEVLGYIYLQKLTAQQQEALNMTALLLADDAGPSYFSLAKSNDDFLLYVQRSLPAVAVSPATLRATIETLVKVTTANEPYWNTRLWKP